MITSPVKSTFPSNSPVRFVYMPGKNGLGGIHKSPPVRSVSLGDDTQKIPLNACMRG